MENSLLEIRNLKTVFHTEYGKIPAVDNIDLVIHHGETVGLVGESGCGKSVTALSVLRLLPFPYGEVVGGEIKFRGKDLLDLSESQMRKIRGKEISMVFQEPMTSLNPVYTCGRQISETVQLHEGLSRQQALRKTVNLLESVGMSDARRRVREYPHQLSGGMRQRVMIAMALSCNPVLLIADEPTTALDVTIQAQILDLLRALKEKHNMALLLITHDLGVVAQMAARVVVMYAGKVVEVSDVVSLFRKPLHPYTQGLLRSIPRLDQDLERLATIEGAVPMLTEEIVGCRFYLRCQEKSPRCQAEEPQLIKVAEGREVACWNAQNDMGFGA
jgi:oligopeptide transport system ATP-binding protein